MQVCCGDMFSSIHRCFQEDRGYISASCKNDKETVAGKVVSDRLRLQYIYVVLGLFGDKIRKL